MGLFYEQRKKSVGLAFGLEFLIPGVGLIYAYPENEIGRGFFWARNILIRKLFKLSVTLNSFD